MVRTFLTPDEAIHLDKFGGFYPVPVDQVEAIIQRAKEAWPSVLSEKTDFAMCMFLFECGRIYGIRQERARRKGNK